MSDQKSLVVARYNEDVSWVDQFIDFDLYVYNKGDHLDRECVSLENINRESDTFLHHIINNYDQLTDYIVFCQGNPFDHCDLSTMIKSHTSGFFPLGDVFSCDGNGRPHDSGIDVSGTSDRIGIPSSDSYDFCVGAQYIVPSSMITNKPLEWWKNVKSVHDSTDRAPWVFERLWIKMFESNCNE
jgi:hypothetical protein